MNNYRRHPNPVPQEGHRRFSGPRPAPAAHVSTAPAVRVQNLRKLESTCGQELLAIKLGIALGRLKEMLEGVNFSAEMAYHIEVSLQLASGFMDRAGISISDEDCARLKAPPSDEFFDEPVTSTLNTVADPPPEKPPGKDIGTSAEQPLAPRPAVSIAAVTESIVLKETSMSATATLPVDTSSEEAEVTLREVRRANFELLTEPKGVKSRLVSLTGLSPANISHRLHGHKIFDQETGEFFCAKLGLPSGWFEAPRKQKDVPSAVTKLLTGAVAGSAAPSAAQPRSTSKTAMPKPPGVPLAKTRAQSTAAPAPSSAGTVLSLSAAARGGALTAAARRRVDALARQPETGAVAVAEPTARVASEVAASPAVRTLSDAGPLAQAALAVLSLRVQEGRVSEDQALRLLSEVAAY